MNDEAIFYFCDNPLCQYHIKVDWEIIERGILYINVSPNTFKTKEVKLHTYKVKFDKYIFLCDVCNNAIAMMKP